MPVRAQSPPVLLVVSVVPIWPVENGFQLRESALVRELSALWKVVLVSPVPSTLPPGFDGLAHLEPVSIAARWTHLPASHDHQRLPATVKSLTAAWKPAAALFLCGAEYLASHLPRSLPFVADHIDCLTLAAIESMRARRGARARAGAARDAWRMARFERWIARTMRCTIVAGRRDARLLRWLAGGGRLRVIPNGVEAADESRWEARASEPTVAFTGVLDYPPNTDAARHLARDVWPRVRRLVPEARLLLVGRRPPRELRALAAEDSSIRIHADVPDVGPFLRESWLAAAPMRLGSGVKNKVLEAWAAGRAAVMTSRTVNGLPLPPDHDRLVADGSRPFARRIVELLRDPERLEQLGRAAQVFARVECTWRQTALRVHEQVTEALAR